MVAVSSAILIVTLFSSMAFASDSPSGFFYGADGFIPTFNGTSVPYTEPVTGGGVAGSYVGEVWTWTDWQGCTTGRALNNTDITEANDNTSYTGDTPAPADTSLYWYMAGPGADPNYNGTTTEAEAWGETPAKTAIAHYNSDGSHANNSLLFMDIEEAQKNESGDQTSSNGWNHVLTNTCGTSWNASSSIPASVDRATFNGFWDYIENDTSFWPAVYSSPSYWNETFGTGSAGSIPDTYQWTSETDDGVTNPSPAGWCQSGYGCAQWFGGVSSNYELMWQWASNASGDYDQFDANNNP